MSNIRWPTLVAIPILVVATWMNLYWVWGVLFVYWSVRAIRSGEAFVVETIRRDENPILFWLITVAWTGFGLYYVIVGPSGLLS